MSSLLIGHIISTVRLHNYLYFASKVIFVYDFFLMFDEELSFIVKSRWTPVKFTYVLSRYIPFIEFGVIAYHQGSSHLSNTQCRMAYRANGCFDVIGMAMSEALLSYRLWIIWKKDRTVAYGLTALLLVLSVASLAIVNIFVNSLNFFQFPDPLAKGCFYSSASRIILVVWLMVLTYNSVLALLVTKGASLYSGYHSRLIDRLHRVGLLYYAVLFVASALNIVIVFSLPSEYVILLSSMLRSLHSNVSSRAILHVRADRDTDSVVDEFSLKSTTNKTAVAVPA